MACRRQPNRTYGIARVFREQIRVVAEIFGKTLSQFPCLSPANRCDRSNAFSSCDSGSHRLAIQLFQIDKAERSGLRAIPIWRTSESRECRARTAQGKERDLIR